MRYGAWKRARRRARGGRFASGAIVLEGDRIVTADPTIAAAHRRRWRRAVRDGGVEFARRPFLVAFLAAGATGCRADAQSPAAFAGTWHGLLDLGAQRMRLRFEIGQTGASMTNLDQGGEAVPASRVEINGARITLEFASINGLFEGRLREGRIEGEWREGVVFPLTLSRDAPAPPPPPEPLTAERLSALRARCGAPALAAAAKHRDGRRIDFVSGVRALGRSEAASTADKWHLGSITKSMTATLVARCVEAGAVAWDDTLHTILGEAIPDMRAEYRDVTYRHLLSHRAGLPAQAGDLLRYPREERDARASRIAHARQALAQAPARRKEQAFLYSNSGYVLAGAMLEATLGAPWEKLIRERVFAPLRLGSAGFGAPGARGAYDQPMGHGPSPLRALAPRPPGDAMADNPAVLGPAGRVHASLADMLAYLGAHRDRTPFLRRETWSVLHTPPFGGDYALGWFKDGEALRHGGSNTLWCAEAWLDSASGAAGVAAANDGRLGLVNPAVYAALHGAIRAIS